MNIDHIPLAPPPSGANYSAEQGCFEGPEKLLEIWFAPSPRTTPVVLDDSDLSDVSQPPTPIGDSFPAHYSDLRTVKKPVWDEMLATVKCTVLNVIHSAHVDAYLLSESSMFVYPHKLVIKTCGTTTLLRALPHILDIAKTHCDYHQIHRLFYSRKSFMFPEKQPGPHRSWNEEVKYLDEHFERGASYIIGDTNLDEWYLYLTAPTASHKEQDVPTLLSETDGLSWMADDGEWTKMALPLLPREDCLTSSGYRMHDQTIEILMTQLDPDAMTDFYHRSGAPSGHEGGRLLDAQTGLGAIYPDAKIDSFLFEPCGYSANGLLDDGYYTIHVTPEPQCSYASFETTIPATQSHAIDTAEKLGRGNEECVRKLILQVLDIFRPGSFTVTYFSSQDKSGSDGDVERMMRTISRFGGYRRKDRILHEFDGYDFIFGHYTKVQ